jgi:hypothetical protein
MAIECHRASVDVEFLCDGTGHLALKQYQVRTRVIKEPADVDLARVSMTTHKPSIESPQPVRPDLACVKRSSNCIL